MRIQSYSVHKKHVILVVTPEDVHRNALLLRDMPGVNTVFEYPSGILSVYGEDRGFDEVLRALWSLQDEGTELNPATL